MTPTLFPCLWFDKDAGVAADFYLNLLGGSIRSQNPIVTEIEVRGTRLMFLNGGSTYRQNPAFSLFLYCESETEINRVYAALTEGGSVLMPLGPYDWSPRYAWVQDKFGVSWQLDADPIRCDQKILPAVLLIGEQSGRIKEAVNQYTSIIPGSRILLESPFPPGSGQPDGALLFAQIHIGDLFMNLMSSPMPHAFALSPAGSIVVSCETQEEIDQYWEQLSNGGQTSRCGWLTDRFGLSWQVIPSRLGEWMQDPVRGARVMQTLLGMDKLVLSELETA